MRRRLTESRKQSTRDHADRRAALRLVGAQTVDGALPLELADATRQPVRADRAPRADLPQTRVAWSAPVPEVTAGPISILTPASGLPLAPFGLGRPYSRHHPCPLGGSRKLRGSVKDRRRLSRNHQP